jgi:hypothetical protein
MKQHRRRRATNHGRSLFKNQNLPWYGRRPWNKTHKIGGDLVLASPGYEDVRSFVHKLLCRRNANAGTAARN